jgi:hypothetical protein
VAKAKFVKERREVEAQEQQEHEQQAEVMEQQAEERLQQVMEQQVADSIKGKGKGTEYHQLSFGSSDEDDFSLEELKKMEDAINFSVALSGNHKLSAKLRRRIVTKRKQEVEDKFNREQEEAQQTKQTKTKQITQSINQTIRPHPST